jgi:hypothetical protein
MFGQRLGGDLRHAVNRLPTAATMEVDSGTDKGTGQPGGGHLTRHPEHDVSSLSSASYCKTIWKLRAASPISTDPPV